MISLFLKLMCLLRDTFFAKLLKVARRLLINSSVGCDNAQPRVTSGEREDEYIRDQLIDKCYSAKLRRKFLEKDDSVNLNDLFITARAQEAVDLQMVAPEKYQQIIRDVLRGCEGVVNIADNLVIYGNGVKQHDERLFDVLNRLKEVGVTLNGDKYEFRLPRLTFFGHQVTQNGVEPSEETVAAIRNADPPQNASEARSFLGLAQFVSKFIPDLYTVAEPIQRLTHKNVEFKWQSEQQAAFDKLKELITSTTALAYCDVNSKTRIVADASPVGLGAVLIQLQGIEWRVIAYASRGLTDVEPDRERSPGTGVGLRAL